MRNQQSEIAPYKILLSFWMFYLGENGHESSYRRTFVMQDLYKFWFRENHHQAINDWVRRVLSSQDASIVFRSARWAPPRRCIFNVHQLTAKLEASSMVKAWDLLCVLLMAVKATADEAQQYENGNLLFNIPRVKLYETPMCFQKNQTTSTIILTKITTILNTTSPPRTDKQQQQLLQPLLKLLKNSLSSSIRLG